MEIWPGKPYPLGADWDGAGVNFALFSESAEWVELCLFDQPFGAKETERIRLPHRTANVWHGYFPLLRPGQLYGYRVHGRYAPSDGQRFNSNKLLVDPYAKAIAGDVRWSTAPYGYTIGHHDGDRSFDERDSAPNMPKSVVIDTAFTWGGDQFPQHAWSKTLIYELHVKGFTQLHPDLPPELRGTYAGLGHPAITTYLQSLGVTAVELLPVQHFVADHVLVERDLTNYWGYNTLGFFAPDARYAYDQSIGGQVNEFRSMVKALHAAGIEVILDVVYNHTAEGNHMGATLCFRGIDNAAYYRLQPDGRYYTDYTGCGNTLNTQHPRVLQLIADSLRYWVEVMHVDGFRFDLTSALLRDQHHVNMRHALLSIIGQDPVLSRVKLIAEPWDLGEGGYRVGQFPAPWREWNDQYRDNTRRFWCSEFGLAGKMASCLTGSSYLYEHHGRSPTAGVNFITAHDGFTLNDLVTYERKYNEANGEDNRDGHNDNHSWNCGAEGPTKDASVNALRARQKRNMLATLMLSQGTRMMLAGDELSRTQQGNNNAYCQDNEIAWVDWTLDGEPGDMLAFTRQLMSIFHACRVLHRTRFYKGRVTASDEDLTWLRPDGRRMTQRDWENEGTRCFGMRLNGHATGEVDDTGKPVVDTTLLIMLNAHTDAIRFKLPGPARGACRWELVLDTATPRGLRKRPLASQTHTVALQSHSLVVLRMLESAASSTRPAAKRTP